MKIATLGQFTNTERNWDAPQRLSVSLVIELQEMRPTADALLSLEKNFSRQCLSVHNKSTMPPTQKYKINILIATQTHLRAMLFKGWTGKHLMYCFGRICSESTCVMFSRKNFNHWLFSSRNTWWGDKHHAEGLGRPLPAWSCKSKDQRCFISLLESQFFIRVKTERMTLQLMAPRIYSHEVGSIRH